MKSVRVKENSTSFAFHTKKKRHLQVDLMHLSISFVATIPNREKSNDLPLHTHNSAVVRDAGWPGKVGRAEKHTGFDFCSDCLREKYSDYVFYTQISL